MSAGVDGGCCPLIQAILFYIVLDHFNLLTWLICTFSIQIVSICIYVVLPMSNNLTKLPSSRKSQKRRQDQKHQSNDFYEMIKTAFNSELRPISQELDILPILNMLHKINHNLNSYKSFYFIFYILKFSFLFIHRLIHAFFSLDRKETIE